jgi:hypothetical protein
MLSNIQRPVFRSTSSWDLAEFDLLQFAAFKGSLVNLKVESSKFALDMYEFVPGLPDGLFSNQKSQFGQILDGLRMKNAGMFYGHME